MIIFFSASQDVNQIVGSENPEQRQKLQSHFQKAFGSQFEANIQIGPALPIKMLRQRQQWANRPFPPPLEAQNLTSSFYQAQFQNQFTNLKPDAIILSIEPDLYQPIWQHKEEGFLLCPNTDCDSQWLQDTFEPIGLTSPSEYEANLLALVEEIKANIGTAILILNGSTIDPNDSTFNYNNQKDTLPVRINRFNLALLRVSMQAGISIIDVDRLAAESGDPHVLSPLRYSDTLNNIIQQEVVRIINDLALEEGNQPLYKLEMPYVDLTVKEGTVANWHKAAGDSIHVGDKLVDIAVQFQIMKRTHSARFLSRTKTKKAGGKMGRLLVQLISAGEGKLHQIYTEPNSTVQQGTLMAAITAENPTSNTHPIQEVTNAALFRVSAQKLSIGEDQ